MDKTQALIETLRATMEKYETIDPCSPAYIKMREYIASLPDFILKEIMEADIKFISMLASNEYIGRNAEDLEIEGMLH